MRTKLFEYGIHTEKSDQRAHVCFKAGKVYTYKTWCGIEAINKGVYKAVSASQPGVDFVTAKGILVPPSHILGCKSVIIPSVIIKRFPVLESMSTSEKGKLSVEIVQALMRNGLFPFFVAPMEVHDHQMQIDGTDIFVKGSFKVQVKCDFRGGVGNGCTGFLFLQTHECNPLRMT